MEMLEEWEKEADHVDCVPSAGLSPSLESQLVELHLQEGANHLWLIKSQIREKAVA